MDQLPLEVYLTTSDRIQFALKGVGYFIGMALTMFQIINEITIYIFLERGLHMWIFVEKVKQKGL